MDGRLGAAGNASLSWSYHSAGVFRFSSDYYVCAETDSSIVGDSTTVYSVRGARVTVTRVAGATGRAKVDLITADGSATALTDYQTVLATLVFDDWEMSKSVIIPIIWNAACGTNRFFKVNLINPRLDPLESSAVQPPRLDPDHSVSTVLIKDHEGEPASSTNALCAVTAVGLVNFERATYRTTRDVGTRHGLGGSHARHARVRKLPGRWTARAALRAPTIWTMDKHGSPRTTTSICPPARTTRSPIRPAISPGDYHHWPSPDPPDFLPVYDTGPAKPCVGWGKLTWGQGDFAPKPIHITIYNNPMPNFNRDFVIRLYPVPGASDNATIGDIGQTIVTILNDD